MDKTTKVLSLLDIHLASWLSLHGIEPILENRNGKVVFLFEASDNLYRLINQFNSNEPIPIGDYVTRLKTLRGKMLSAREGNGKEYENKNFNR